jgi:hypothetical protein
MAFVPLMIRWGPNTSSDRLRNSARCPRCGGKGAMLMPPSYVDRIVGFQPFPYTAIEATAWHLPTSGHQQWASAHSKRMLSFTPILEHLGMHA